MRQILVATDFSTRSDRAIRRASLLARKTGASLSLLHIVDSDRPDYLVSLDRAAADKALAETCRTIRDVDGLACDYQVTLGDPFEGIVAAAGARPVDLLVIGPHRRQILRDAFVGTTAERVIRYSSVPVLMANGTPSGPYRHILAASDLSPHSAEAVSALARLGLAEAAAFSLFRAVDVPEVALMIRATTSLEDIKHHIGAREAAAADELRAFAATLPLVPGNYIARAAEATTATVILQAAASAGADLVVIGTRGQSGLARFLLGSVAEGVLRSATIDVLVVPPPDPAITP